jgi:hypothetical protein
VPAAGGSSLARTAPKPFAAPKPAGTAASKPAALAPAPRADLVPAGPPRPLPAAPAAAPPAVRVAPLPPAASPAATPVPMETELSTRRVRLCAAALALLLRSSSHNMALTCPCYCSRCAGA